MNPSSLQTQFPLSASKKFMKKMLEKAISVFLLSVLFSAVVGVVLFVIASSGDGVSDNAWIGSVAIAVGFFLLFFLVVMGLYAWYFKTYIKRYYYSADKDFLTIKKNVFTPTEIHVQYQKIQDVYVDQDLLDRFIGLYDVHIASATVSSGIEAHIDGVEKAAAEGLKTFLLNSIRGGAVGSTSSATAQTGTMAAAAQPATKKLTLSEKISNEQYPLTTKWYWVSMLGIVLSNIFMSVIFGLWWGGKNTELTVVNLYLGIGIFVVLTIWRLITLAIWKGNYRFDFLEDYIYYKDGVFSLNERHMPYTSVQDVSVSQGIINRIFGLANVTILDATQVVIANSKGQETAPMGITIQGLSIEDARKIANVVKTSILGISTRGANGL
ncbi:MAG: PH domain-containing protein [Patescibacteria group bacterium]|mgnify:FL=1